MNDEKRKAREECWHIEQEEAIRKLRDGYEDDDEEEEEEMEVSTIIYKYQEEHTSDFPSLASYESFLLHCFVYNL